MNIVFVRHGESKDYCFEVPDDMVQYLKTETTVLVDTRNGLDVGLTTTGVISGDGARDIAEKNGAYFPLKKVVSFLNDELRIVCKNEIVRKLNNQYPQKECLPF